jgi:hypothetical protein
MSCQAVGPVAPLAASRPSCASPAATQEAAATIRAFFAALAVDDEASVRRLTTPNFYAFEVGKRFTGPELSKLIAETHRAGRILQWNVGPVDARVDCNMAFAAWENTGAAGTAGKMQPRNWLESALLLRQGDRWVIDVLHSTPKDPRP